MRASRRRAISVLAAVPVAFAFITPVTLPLAAQRALQGGPPASSGSFRGTDLSRVALQSVSDTLRADARRGLELYAEHCAACHGQTGDGDGRLTDRLPSPPPPFRSADAAKETSLRQTYDTITEGRLDLMMPPFADSLTDEERWSLAAAVQTLRAGPEQLVRGRAAFDQTCAGCHHQSAESGLALRTDGSWSTAARRAAADWSAAGLLDLVRGGADHPVVASVPGDSQLPAVVDYTLSAAFEPVPTDGMTTDGRVEGRVVLLPNGPGLEGIDITATTYAMGLPGSVVTTTTDADGHFALTDRLAGAGVNMLVAADYEGVTYTQVVTPAVSQSAGTASSDLVVYGTTTSAPLVAERAHILLSPAPEAGVIRAVEIWTIENTDQKTLVAQPDGTTLRFLLPPGAEGARFGPGSPQAASQSGEPAPGRDALELGTRSPVRPGASEVSFEYEVPYSSESFDWPVETTLPANEVNLAIVAEGVTMTAGESESRTGDVGGQPVTGLSLGSLVAGESRDVTIGGLVPPSAAPSATARTPEHGWSAIVAAACAVVGVLVAATFPAWGAERANRRRKQHLSARRSALVDAIAALDRHLAAGSLDEAEHRSQRAALMAEAVSIDVLLGQMYETPNARDDEGELV